MARPTTRSQSDKSSDSNASSSSTSRRLQPHRQARSNTQQVLGKRPNRDSNGSSSSSGERAREKKRRAKAKSRPRISSNFVEDSGDASGDDDEEGVNGVRLQFVTGENTNIRLPRDDGPFPPRISVIMATMKADQRLDLKQLARIAKNAEYDKQVNCVTIRHRDPRCTARIFATGRIVLMGTRSVEDCKLAAKKIKETLRKLGVTKKFDEFEVPSSGKKDIFKIVNIAAVAAMGHYLDMEKIALNYPGTEGVARDASGKALETTCVYEPELFAGAVIRPLTGITVLVFQSGRMVITGANTVPQIMATFTYIHGELTKFPKVPLPHTVVGED